MKISYFDKKKILLLPLNHSTDTTKKSPFKNWTMKGRMNWIVTEDIKVKLSNKDTINIPKGFRTDLSSSPRILWSIFPPYGDFLIAALIHDYLYSAKYFKKELGSYRAQRFADKEMFKWSKIYNSNKLDN